MRILFGRVINDVAAIGILPFKLFVILSAKVTVIVKVSSKRYLGNMQNYCRSNCRTNCQSNCQSNCQDDCHSDGIPKQNKTK